MTGATSPEPPPHPADPIVIGLAGNPNSGKTTIFNRITGARQHVGNYPGVTVERKEGHATHQGRSIHVVDLPGTYSLSPYSIEEIVARDFIVEQRPDVVVAIVDGTNLERNLYLTVQILELGARVVVALNMHDEMDARHIHVDAPQLARLLGAPVVPTVGRTGEGLRELLDAVVRVADDADPVVRPLHVNYGRETEQEIGRIRTDLLERTDVGADQPRREHFARWMAVRLIEGDSEVRNRLLHDVPQSGAVIEQAERSRRRLEALYAEESESLVADQVYSFLRGLTREVLDTSRVPRRTFSDRVDSVLTHHVLGLPVFAVLMYLMFQATFTLGDIPKGWIEALFAWVAQAARTVLPSGMLRDLLTDGILSGVGGVVAFLPHILVLFLFMALLEDTGYMARSAFLMDRVMHAMGLHGKSFIALLIGFGCNAPAVMATRTLESRRDRLITMLICPFMSCVARLPVYVLLCGAFFARHQGLIVFALYVLGSVVAVAAGKVLGLTVLRGQSAPFVMELPPYRVPTARSVVLHMWDRAGVFVRKAGTIILVGVALVWALNYFPRHVALSHDYATIREAVAVRYSQHITRANTRYRQALAQAQEQYRHALIPFEDSAVYKELKAYRDATVQSLADQRDDGIRTIDADEARETSQGRWAGTFGRAIEPAIAPLGFDWRIGVSLIPGFVAKEVVVGSLAVLYGHGQADETDADLRKHLRATYTPLQAMALMIFTLLYVPCLATVAVIRREGGWRWALLSIGLSLPVAYAVTLVVYQGGRLLGFGA